MSDLTNLADVRSWLGINNGSEDALLARLIAAVSQDFLNAINRPNFFRAEYNEVRDGNNGSRLVLKNWPIVSVSSVSVDGISIPASDDGVRYGFVYDQAGSLESRTAVSLVGDLFVAGRNNVVIAYDAGYDAAAIPSEIQQAVIDWIALRYRGRQWIGQLSKHMAAGETVSFSQKGIPESTRRVIEQYRRKIAVL